MYGQNIHWIFLLCLPSLYYSLKKNNIIKIKHTWGNFSNKIWFSFWENKNSWMWNLERNLFDVKVCIGNEASGGPTVWFSHVHNFFHLVYFYVLQYIFLQIENLFLKPEKCICPYYSWEWNSWLADGLIFTCAQHLQEFYLHHFLHQSYNFAPTELYIL